MIDIEETIRRLKDEKVRMKIHPSDVLMADLKNEIIRQLKAELNQMFLDGKIIVRNTLNDKSINIL